MLCYYWRRMRMRLFWVAWIIRLFEIRLGLLRSMCCSLIPWRMVLQLDFCVDLPSDVLRRGILSQPSWRHWCLVCLASICVNSTERILRVEFNNFSLTSLRPCWCLARVLTKVLLRLFGWRYWVWGVLLRDKPSIFPVLLEEICHIQFECFSMVAENIVVIDDILWTNFLL